MPPGSSNRSGSNGEGNQQGGFQPPTGFDPSQGPPGGFGNSNGGGVPTNQGNGN
jgi:hypothetical protein